MSESFASILERAPPPEDSKLNETLNYVMIKALGDSYFNRIQTAHTFLKKNEKSNILAKSRSINYNLSQIRNRLALNTNKVVRNEKEKISQPDRKNEKDEKIHKKNLKSLMFSTELWGDRHYQQVIEDSFLMPKLDLNTAKQQSFQLKELTNKFSAVYQRVQSSERKRKAMLTFLNESFQGLIAQKVDPKEFLAKKGSLRFLKDMARPSQSPVIQRIVRASSLKQKTTTSSENTPKKGLLENFVKEAIIVNKCEDSQQKQKVKENFFRQMIESNVGNVNLTASEIEKAREIRKKLVSTYHYAKHKRGKNPFNMLVTGKKEDNIQGVVGKVLEKTKKKEFAKTFHFMTPLEKNQQEKKNEEIKKQESPIIVKENSRKNSSFSQKNETANEFDEIKKRKKKKPAQLKRREFNSHELKQVKIKKI